MILLLLISYIFRVFCIGGSDEPGAIWMPSPNKTPGRDGFQVKWLILHGTAGGTSAQEIGEMFENPNKKAATHYVVGQDGTIVQCVNERDTAWGNGRVEDGADPWWQSSNPGPNYVTISIEHVKSLDDNSNELTSIQKESSWRLIQNILKRNPGIKTHWANSTGGMTGHFSVSPLSRERCPGPFPWEDLFTTLNGQSLPICIGTIKSTTKIYKNPNLESDVIGNLPKGRIINVQKRIKGSSEDEVWFLLHSGEGYIQTGQVKVHIKQPEWCHN